MWNDHNTDSGNGEDDETGIASPSNVSPSETTPQTASVPPAFSVAPTPPATPAATPPAASIPQSPQPGPSPHLPVPPTPARASFSAIGSPKSEDVTTATGATPPRPVAAVTVANGAPAPVARPNTLGNTAAPTPPAFTLGSTAASAAGTSPAVAPVKKKRRTGFFVALAMLTVLASGGVSYIVANLVADDAVSAIPAPLPTAASAPTPTEPATTTATDAVDAAVLAEEPFAVAAEIIRPSVVQLNLGTGLGTGVIINENGTILTAAHVLGDNDDVTVTFFDGSSAQGTVVGTHVPTDVGVVQIDPEGRDLVVARLAEGQDVRVGQIAVAVGSPFGFDQTVTAGIISAVDRIVNNVSMVQTDASINPGNSGGPLINLDGEVVGINDLIFTESGSSAGVGFAISIDLAVIIADQIVQGVEPQLALFGVSTGAAPDGARGAQVGEVVSGSAAEDAGVQVGDVIISLDGVNTRGSADLRAQVIDQVPGTDIIVTVIRDGEEVDLNVTLGQTG